jgi:hypothetical protein
MIAGVTGKDGRCRRVLVTVLMVIVSDIENVICHNHDVMPPSCAVFFYSPLGVTSTSAQRTVSFSLMDDIMT